MNTLADQVVEFTVALVRALGRVGRFDPAQANFARVRSRLFKDLVRLLRNQPELGFVIGPPAVAGGPAEVWVDGTSPQRVELRRIVGPSIGGAFILQLSEILEQRGLVALAFARGLAETEWVAFLDIMSAPPAEKSRAAEATRRLEALAAKGVQHIAAVSEAEQPPAEPTLPWQARVAYARLGHDIRAAVKRGASPQHLLADSERLTSGMAYPYFRKFDLIRTLLCRADIVDKLVASLPSLGSLRALDLMVQGLPAYALHGTTTLILREATGDDLPAEPGATVLRAVAERLLKTSSSRQVDEALRTLCRRKILPITRLPVELQEWVLAETWVEGMRAHPNPTPPKGGPGSDPLRILQKAARYAFIRGMPVEATGILERIKMVDAKAVPGVFDVATVEALLDGFPQAADERRALLTLLSQGGDTAADSVAMVVVGTPDADNKNDKNDKSDRRCQGGAWLLAEMKARGVAAALRALEQEIAKEDTARLLIACVSGKAPASAANTLIRHLKHASPRVRRDALTALTAASRAAAEPHVAAALEDRDENVRIRALLLCASTGVGSDKIIPRAIQLVARDARGAPPQVVRAGIEVVVRRREAGALPIEDAEAALCRLATPIGPLGRLFGKKSPPAVVLVPAIAALGQLGTIRAKRLLGRLGRSADVDIAQAARTALTSTGGRVPMAPMAMIESGVCLTRVD